MSRLLCGNHHSSERSRMATPNTLASFFAASMGRDGLMEWDKVGWDGMERTFVRLTS